MTQEILNCRWIVLFCAWVSSHLWNFVTKQSSWAGNRNGPKDAAVTPLEFWRRNFGMLRRKLSRRWEYDHLLLWSSLRGRQLLLSNNSPTCLLSPVFRCFESVNTVIPNCNVTILYESWLYVFIVPWFQSIK